MSLRPAIAGLVALFVVGTESLKSRPRTQVCASAAVPHVAIGATTPDLCTVYCVPEGKCHEWVRRGAVFSDLGIIGTGDCARKGFTEDAAPEAAASDQQAFFRSVTGPCEGMTLSRFAKLGAPAAAGGPAPAAGGDSEDQRASEEEATSDEPEPVAAAEQGSLVAGEEDQRASEEEPAPDDPEPVAASEEDGPVAGEETEETPRRSSAAAPHKASLNSFWSRLGSRVGSGVRSIWKELSEDDDEISDDDESSTAGGTSSDREHESAALESSEDEESHHDGGGQADEDEDDGEGPATRKRYDNAARFW